MRLPSTAQHDRHDIVASQVQEKCRERNLDLYMVFVDLTKAFDTISRDGSWQILRKIGFPDLFVDIYGHSTKGWWPEYKIKDKRQSHSR